MMKTRIGLLALAGAVSMASILNATPLQPVPIQSVQIDDPFWSPKIQTWRAVTIDDCLNKFDNVGAMRNFDHIAKGELKAEHGGPPWYDGLVYQMITASADFLAEQRDEKLEARIDGIIDRIAAAAKFDKDGYLNTYTQMKEPDHRWGTHGGNDRWQHDLYNAGTMVEAAVHYYRATGKTTLLATAVRLTNLMCDTMGPSPRQNIIPGHAVGEEAMINLHQLFVDHPELKDKLGVPVNEKRYLELGQFWIDARGHHEGRTSFGAYDQDDVPVLQQTAIEGHAVRAALMASGLTKLGMATGRDDYAQTAHRLWENMVGRRMYITGGVGSDPNDEKFANDYMLPNHGYAETCAAVANGFLDRNINFATGDATAVDEFERTLYNGSLSGVSLAGTSYFYENPLQSSPSRVRWDWHGCPCCPPMFLKLMSSLPGTIYATDSAGGVYVNLYVGSKATVPLKSGNVQIVQTTKYPQDGDVKFAIDPQQSVAFDLSLRVPSWCASGSSVDGLYRSAAGGANAFTVNVNGQSVTDSKIERGYLKLNRTWQKGDVVDIKMAMPIQRVKADDRVEANRGRVTLMRGPIVYCIESVDNDGAIGDFVLPEDAKLTTEAKGDLLGGVTLIHAAAQRVQPDGSTKPATLTAIPYYANANRGPVSMMVWLPTEAKLAHAPKEAAPTTAPTTAPADAAHWMPPTTPGK